MYKKNQGYGICGSKNIYSSKTRMDNWVEDSIGMDLAQSERPPYKLYTTVTQESHNDPSLRPEPKGLPLNIPTPLELKTKNKEGMPYSLLFEHNNNVPADERFLSVTMKTMSRPDLQPTPSRTLLAQKSKAMIDDINKSFVKTTEYRSQNANLKYRPNNVADADPSPQVALPNFTRTRPLTSQFPNFMNNG